MNETATPYCFIQGFSKMVVPTEIPKAECLKRTVNNDTDTKTNNNGIYEHALCLTHSLMLPLTYTKANSKVVNNYIF
jgi:hypothetical protein